MSCCGDNAMREFDDWQTKITGKTKGIYALKEISYHDFFGKLIPGTEYIIPDDWDFKKTDLFKPITKGAK